MKEEVIELDTVDKYNKFFKVETYHPMVTVVDLSKITQPAQPFTINYGIYALFLKDTLCGDITYGDSLTTTRKEPLSVLHRDRWLPSTRRKERVPPDTDCSSIRILFAVPNWDTTSGIILSSLTKPAKPCTSRKKNGTR